MEKIYRNNAFPQIAFFRLTNSKTIEDWLEISKNFEGLNL
jgi:hypothetical protein